MATPRQVTLGIYGKKSDATIGAGSTADASVIVEFDKDNSPNDVVVALQKVIERILEDEY